jgi:hypothetical protein
VPEHPCGHTDIPASSGADREEVSFMPASTIQAKVCIAYFRARCKSAVWLRGFFFNDLLDLINNRSLGSFLESLFPLFRSFPDTFLSVIFPPPAAPAQAGTRSCSGVSSRFRTLFPMARLGNSSPTSGISLPADVPVLRTQGPALKERCHACESSSH